MTRTPIIQAPVVDLACAPCGLPVHRLRRAAGACALLVLALFRASPAAAIGPETPVDFLDVYVPKGFMLLLVEPDQVASLEVTRIVHQGGEPRVREHVEWKALRMLDYTAPVTGADAFKYRDPREHGKLRMEPDRAAPGQLPSIDLAQARPELRLADPRSPVLASDRPPRRVGVLIPLESKAQRELKDGVYAEKYVARASLVGEAPTTKPLTMVRWSHFVLRDGQPRFISQAEYSRMVDPPSDGFDGAGARIQLNVGRDARADVPVEKTPLNRAVPIGLTGPRGGVAPERDDSRADVPCNEAHEK
jgi:hypothetical protein